MGGSEAHLQRQWMTASISQWRSWARSIQSPLIADKTLQNYEKYLTTNKNQRKMNRVAKILKDNIKAVIASAVIVVLVIIAVIWIKKMKKKIEDEKFRKNAQVLTGMSLTEGLDHRRLCVEIAEACKGLGPLNTDEDAIYGALSSIVNQADWEYMQEVWVDTFTSLSTFDGTISRSVFGLKSTIPATLTAELNSSELQQCRDILKSKNIDPGF